MTLKTIVIIGAIIMSLLSSTIAAAASTGRDLDEDESESGLYNENGYVLSKQNRPPINPDFDPDRSCLFDVFQLKCIPGSEQDCPEGFGRNEDTTCWAITFINGEWVRYCPEDYHSTEGDETGQCYPNSKGCEEAALLNEERTSRFEYILLTGDDSPDKYDRCANPAYLCYYNGGSQPDHPGCEEYRKWRSDSNN